jgi:hypothetical protein
MKIFEKMKDLSFYDTFITLNDKELNTLIDRYGSKWYNYFFITHHINSSIENINKNIQKKNELIEKIGSEWVKIHIDNQKYIIKNHYNFQTVYKKLNFKKHKTDENEQENNDFYIENNNTNMLTYNKKM